MAEFHNELSVALESGPAEYTVCVRWWDGYYEEFVASEVRFGSDLLWMHLTSGQNRHIPLRMVRWFSMNPESHQKPDFPRGPAPQRKSLSEVSGSHVIQRCKTCGRSASVWGFPNLKCCGNPMTLYEVTTTEREIG